MTLRDHTLGDEALEDQLQVALDGKAKPLGSLGRIEALAVQLGLIQGTLRPVVDAAVLVFAGDHGAAPGVSAYPSSVTAAMVGAYLGGRAAVNLFARQSGAQLVVVDAGVAADLPRHPGLVAAKVGPGTRDWRTGPAMTVDELDQALRAAAAVVDRLAHEGCTVLALGEMGDRQHRQRRPAGAQGGRAGSGRSDGARRRAGRRRPGPQAGGDGDGRCAHRPTPGAPRRAR